MKLLEKDIHEKQDTIVSLRRQLEDIKQINLEMYNKLQVYAIIGFKPIHFFFHPQPKLSNKTNNSFVFLIPYDLFSF